MIPWERLATITTASGNRMELVRRDAEYVIRIDGQDLMGSRMHDSEEDLARLGCAPILNRRNARVLIGGLGLGYTLRAALDVMGKDAQVDVAELVPEVVEWNRGILAHLAGEPLLDPRAFVVPGDVGVAIGKAVALYDAILLDTDNGPAALTTKTNSALYSNAGIERTLRALKPGGVFGVWAVADDEKFTARLERIGFKVRVQVVAARKGKGHSHVLWLAEALPKSQRGPRPSPKPEQSRGKKQR